MIRKDVHKNKQFLCCLSSLSTSPCGLPSLLSSLPADICNCRWSAPGASQRGEVASSDLQSAYRAHHSTETAVLKMLADILQALDTGDLAMLTLLDLSAAYETVDHATLLRLLEVSYGLLGLVLCWFQSYLDGHMQYVRLPPSPFFCADYHRVRSVNRSCPCSIWWTCCGWLTSINSAHICMLTTHRYTASAIHRRHHSVRGVYLHVSTRLLCGCRVNGFS